MGASGLYKLFSACGTRDGGCCASPIVAESTREMARRAGMATVRRLPTEARVVFRVLASN